MNEQLKYQIAITLIPGVGPVLARNLISYCGGVVTDVTGRYDLKIQEGDFTLIFSFIGYESLSKKITLKRSEARILNVELNNSSKELSTVVVSAGKFEQKIEEVTMSMAVINNQRITDVNTNSMEHLLEEVPGLTVIDGQANIRGGSGFLLHS